MLWGDEGGPSFPMVQGRNPPSCPLLPHSGWHSAWEMFVAFSWMMRPVVGVCLRESEPQKRKWCVGFGLSGRPMVISSGMQSMDTMKQVYQIVKPLNPNFCFLQCTSAYPLLPEDVNLRVISVSGLLSDGSQQNGFSWAIDCGEGVSLFCNQNSNQPWHAS